MEQVVCVREVVERLRSCGDGRKALEMAAYMRNRFEFLGVPTPVRRAAYKDVIAAAKRAKVIDWELLDECWVHDEREFQYFVADYLRGMIRHLKFEDIPLIENYIRSKQWWDTIDSLDLTVGKIGLTDNRVDGLMLEWSVDDDFWVRRCAIDHQLCRKDKTKPDLLEQIIVNNLGSDEFFINKAIGWSLRDYGKTNPTWVMAFIERYRNIMSRLSIREATKHL